MLKLSGKPSKTSISISISMKIGTVEKELPMLNSSKATGWDGIPPKILKATGKRVAPSLTRLFNTIIEKDRKGTLAQFMGDGGIEPSVQKGRQN